MERRAFLSWATLAPGALAAETNELPKYHVVSAYKPAEPPGMPGRHAGQVVAVHAERSIETGTDKADVATVREMIASGMRALTGDKDARDSWARFFTPADFIGIKVNCSGAPHIMSTPEVVGEIVRNLTAIGIKPDQVWIYERFPDQLDSVHYDRYVPAGVHITAIETSRRSIAGYDPKTYVEVDFFGEDDTRSNLIRVVSERFTKIINVPNMKDHGAAGVTGCLKNIAYGDFSNVARSHYGSKTNTLSFIGTLAAVEPLRSKTVLQIMDGLRGVWQGGPFLRDLRYRFYPRQMMFGTDPVAIDRQLLDIIDGERKKQGAISVWERTTDKHKSGSGQYIREPGHIEFASKLGLGVYDMIKINRKDLKL
jgi:uncharacterized protein (DUF362 family)